MYTYTEDWSIQSNEHTKKFNLFLCLYVECAQSPDVYLLESDTLALLVMLSLTQSNRSFMPINTSK